MWTIKSRLTSIYLTFQLIAYFCLFQTEEVAASEAHSISRNGSSQKFGQPVVTTDEVEKNVTRSRLSLVPTERDDGEKITCRAENPWVPHSFVEDSWTLPIVCMSPEFFIVANFPR